MNIVKCYTVDELLSAINIETKIKLIGNRYSFTDIILEGHEYVSKNLHNQSDDLIFKNLKNLNLESDKKADFYINEGSFIFENCTNIQLKNIEFNAIGKNIIPIKLINCLDVVLQCNIKSNSNIVIETVNCANVVITASDTDGLVKIDNSEKIYFDMSVCKSSVGLRPLSIEDEVAVTVNEKYDKMIKKIEVNPNINIVYISEEKIVINNDKEEYINDRMPSLPIVSTNNRKCAFIAPYAWEVIGDLYVYDFIKNTCEIVLKAEDMKQQKCIKKILWKDENELYLIIGMAYGTVSRGGNLYKFNVINKHLEEIFTCVKAEEVVDFSLINEKLQLNIIKFDSNYQDYEERIQYI